MAKLDEILAYVVMQAVNLTGAEAGRLLLTNSEDGKVYLRAGFHFEDSEARLMREPDEDPLARRVIESGKPERLDRSQEAALERYLERTGRTGPIHGLICVPLRQADRTIGALAVENRENRSAPLGSEHITGLAVLADFGTIAIENARAVSRSINEKRRTEDMLMATADGVILVDKTGCMIRVNPAARRILGLGGQDVAGQPVRILLEDADLVAAIEDPHMAVELRLELDPGDGRHFILHIHPVPGAGKTITIQDVTHFKELDRVKSDFVTAISHDLRSPLTAVLGYLELIGRVGEVNDRQRAFIRRIRTSVNSITDLINDLLELGRIEADFDQHKERLPLAVILEYSANRVQNRVDEKDQSLEIDIRPDLPEVFGSPVRLRQMIGNLLDNAVKYTPRGGTIRASLRAEEAQVILEVSDTGIGIPPSDLPHIFDRLYRARNVSLDTPGTGLGLAIVNSIVNNHGGRLWCDSKQGRGSTFTVVLPAASGY